MLSNLSLKALLRSYSDIAGKAAAFELLIRLISCKCDGPNNAVVDTNLEALIDSLRKRSAHLLEDAEWQKLHSARRLRNKIFHGELDTATQIAGASSGGVLLVSLTNGAVEPVAARTTKEIGIFPWLLNFLAGDGPQTAAQILLEAMQIAHKLLIELDKEGAP